MQPLFPVILRQIIDDGLFVGIIDGRTHHIDHLADCFLPAGPIQTRGVHGDIVQTVAHGALRNDLVPARPIFQNYLAFPGCCRGGEK